MGNVATIREIQLYDIVEVLEPVDAAPAGSRGGVIEFVGDNHEIAEIEITDPKLDGLDAIVYTTLDKLRVVEPHAASSDSAHSD
jgi:hypothetical protein